MKAVVDNDGADAGEEVAASARLEQAVRARAEGVPQPVHDEVAGQSSAPAADLRRGLSMSTRPDRPRPPAARSSRGTGVRAAPTLALRLFVVAAAAVLGVLTAVLTTAGAPAHADGAHGAHAAVAVAGTESSSATSGAPSQDATEDYDSEVGGPHQDTPSERTGESVTTGRLVFIGIVVVVTLTIVLTLAVRGRRRRTRGAP